MKHRLRNFFQEVVRLGGMGLYMCIECEEVWTGVESETCGECGFPVMQDGCPACGSDSVGRVDLGEELFYLLDEGLTPARALYYYLNRVQGLPVKDIAELSGRSETSVYNVVQKAEEAVGDE